MKTLRTLAIAATLAAAAGLGGCGATAGTKAHIQTSTFDGSRTVYIEAHGTNCGMSMVCSMLGAQWNSAAPAQAQLVVETMGSYASINRAALNIDGQIIRLEPTATATQYRQSISQAPGTYSSAIAALGRTSTQTFRAPLDLVRRMLAAKDVRLRVVTSETTIESTVFSPAADSKAHHALQRFVAQVDAARAEKT